MHNRIYVIGPVGSGKTTFATELVKIINPKVVIPIHYGFIIGDREDGIRFMNNLSNTNIEVVEKIF